MKWLRVNALRENFLVVYGENVKFLCTFATYYLLLTFSSTMNVKKFSLMSLLCLLLLWSCSDDMPRTSDSEIDDNYVGALKLITLANGMEEVRQPEF